MRGASKRHQAGRMRSRDYPCAVCGNLILADQPSKTKQKTYCSRPCQMKARAMRIGSVCVICQCSFEGSRVGVKTCSQSCKTVLRRRTLADSLPMRTCKRCEKSYQPAEYNQDYCTKSCTDKHWSQLRRDRLAKSIHCAIDIAEIYERDGGNCGICHKLISAEYRWPHKMSMALDHIYPVSKGGAHVPSNVQIAHASCNSRKHAKVDYAGAR